MICDATMPAAPTYPVSIIDEPLAAATQNTSYSATVYAAGGGPVSYKFSLSQGALPKGLKLNKTTGTISGTPSKPGTSTFAIEVVDNGATAIRAESITVAPDVPLTVKTTKLPAAKANVPYTKSLAATGGTALYLDGVGRLASVGHHARIRWAICRRHHSHG